MEPSSEDIESVSAVLGLPLGEASRWLKAYDRDPSKAMNAYFDNGGILQETFAIHRSDTLNPQIFNDNAPSRPPSRASARGLAVTADLRNGDRTGISLAEQERQDFDQAMAMSQSMGQENGVIESQKPLFGPATREHYDTAKWTMTLPGARAREIIENPDPTERQRGPHSPAFLKPSLENTRLPALLTILHAIPLAREALLNLDHTLSDYGVDGEWWDGVPIDRRTLQVRYSDREEQRVCYSELVYEVQRLMAFLDGTKRAYGSADALLQLIKATENGKVDQSLGQILEAWSMVISETDPNTVLSEIFRSEAVQVRAERFANTEFFCCFDLVVPTAAEPGSLECCTLYDVLDSALWVDLHEDSSDYAFLPKVGNVLCVQIEPQNREQSAGLGVKIPAAWYLDRYLESSKQQILRMLAAQPSLKEELTRIDQAKARITEYKPSDNEPAYNASPLLEKARHHFAKPMSGTPNANGSSSGVADDSNLKLLDELERLSESVKHKLQDLETARTKAMENFAEISQWYTKASEDPKDPPYHKYTLRGVSAAKDTTYVLEKVSADESSATMDESSIGWQWWKLSYSSGQEQVVSRARVREAEVLKAARDESLFVLLVYADEKAMSSTVSELPSQLQNFVRADNLNFATELENFQNAKPTTPTKRKVDDLDDGDMVTEHHHSSDDDRASVDTVLGDDPASSPPRWRSASRSPPRSRDELG